MSQLKKIRLLIADDHNIVRQGLISILEEQKNFVIVAEAEDGETMHEKYFTFRPDVVLTDISMPKLNGFDASKKILVNDKNAKIIFLTMHNSEEYIYKAIKIGVSGLITKDVIKGELIEAIETVAEGGTYFCKISEDGLKKIRNKFEKSNDKLETTNTSLLTEREKEILKYISQGFTSDEIAELLMLGRRSVDRIRSSIMEKLNIKTLPQLIRFAVELTYFNSETP